MKFLLPALFSLLLLTACSSDQANSEAVMNQEGEPIPETTLLERD